MTGQIEIIERNPLNTAEIAAVAATWKLPRIMQKAFSDLMKHLEQEGVKPSGEPYTRYRNLNWDELNRESRLAGLVHAFTRKWDMLIGFPVERPINATGGVRAGTMPGGKYVRTIHRGPYSTVTVTYKAMSRFISGRDIKAGNE